MRKTAYLCLRNFQISVLHRPRWVFAMIASFFVVGFVALTAIPTLIGLNNFYMEDQNIYEIPLRENVLSRDLQNSVQMILDRYPGTEFPNLNIKLYAPAGNSEYSYIIGRNDRFFDMDVAGRTLKGNLFGAEDIIWLGQGFWNAHKDLHFPYTDIRIGDREFEVVGIAEIGISESLLEGRTAGLPVIADTQGNILPLYDSSGELFQATADHTNTRLREYFSAIIPLATQFEMDMPVSFLEIFLPRPASEEDTAFIANALSGFAEGDIEHPQGNAGFTIGTMLALVTLAAVILCLLQLANAVWSNLWSRGNQLRAFLLAGYSSGRIAGILLTEMVVLQLVGYALCIWPSSAVIQLAARYANPRVILAGDMVLYIGILNMVLIGIWYLGIALFCLRRIRRNGGAMA